MSTPLDDVAGAPVRPSLAPRKLRPPKLPPRAGRFPYSPTVIVDGEEERARRTSVALSRARGVENTSWSAFWFCAGAGAAASYYASGTFWVFLALVLWVTAIAFSRKRSRLARSLLALEGQDLAARESLRAKAALGGLGEALHSVGDWASEVSRFVIGATTPPPVNPEIPIPPNPVPRDAGVTVPPPAKRGEVLELPPVTPRLEEPPPSHPALSRDPDHDPKTCKVCQNSSQPPPRGFGYLSSVPPAPHAPPRAPSLVPSSPLPVFAADLDEDEVLSGFEVGPDSVPYKVG